jgi:hypothetical protein
VLERQEGDLVVRNCRRGSAAKGSTSIVDERVSFGDMPKGLLLGNPTIGGPE